MKKQVRNPAQISMTDEIIVDSFAGGGGASTGIEVATGRVVEIAINHDPDAILMHSVNHPFTEHYQASVWDIDPKEVCKGRPVGLAWFSPDCKHFSKAKGAALVDKKIRGLAWIVLRWAAKVRPRVIILENVEEFVTWGPVRKGKPVKKKAGQTFRKWKNQLLDLGYAIDHRELVAADYGAPTSRKRFVLVARCDGRPIIWPERTHAPADHPDVIAGKLLPWRSAAEIIDWSLPCPSIFASKAEIKAKYGLEAVRPLADNTQRRVIRGMDKHTIQNAKPFIVPVGYGERHGQAPRVHDVDKPLPTVVGTGKQYLGEPKLTEPLHTVVSHDREALTMPFLQPFHAGGYHGKGNSPDKPVNTVTSSGGQSLVTAQVAEFKGEDLGQSADKPLRTITSSWGQFADLRVQVVRYDGERTAESRPYGYWPEIRTLLNKYCGYSLAEDEILLLNIEGVWYYISDIGLRMLTPRELYNAMGFPPDYVIDFINPATGKPYSKAAKVARCGNAVCPPMAEAVVRANLPEWCDGKIETMEQFRRVVAV